MASYAEQSLATGESIRYSAQLSLWRFWPTFLIGGVLLVGSMIGIISSWFRSSSGGTAGSIASVGIGIAFVVALGLLIWPFMARKATELVITNKRVVAKFGMLSTHSIEIRFGKVETVRVAQTLLGRMLDYGDIVLTGTGSTFDPIRHISHPIAFRTALNEAMEQMGQPTAQIGPPSGPIVTAIGRDSAR